MRMDHPEENVRTVMIKRWISREGEGRDAGLEGLVEPEDRDGTEAGTAMLLHSRKQEYCPAQLWDVTSNTGTKTLVPAGNLKEIQSSLMGEQRAWLC